MQVPTGGAAREDTGCGGCGATGQIGGVMCEVGGLVGGGGRCEMRCIGAAVLESGLLLFECELGRERREAKV